MSGVHAVTKIVVLFVLILAGCSKQDPVQVQFDSYEDCILGKLGRGQSKIASEALIAACRAKFPLPAEPIAVASLPSPTRSIAGENPYLDLIPKKPPGEQVAKFHGYDCQDDCSGHEAGYEWAERKGITDPDDCRGNSDSFIEGCVAFTEEE